MIVFIDEIDAVRSLPFRTDEFFAAIRECYNRRADDPALQRLCFCLLGVATPADLIEDTPTTPFNIGRRIDLTDFTEEEAKPLAGGLFHHGVTEHPEGKEQDRVARRLLDRVLFWTGGRPFLTQKLCRAIVARRARAAAGSGNPQSKAPIPPFPHSPDRLVDSLCHELWARSRRT